MGCTMISNVKIALLLTTAFVCFLPAFARVKQFASPDTVTEQNRLQTYIVHVRLPDNRALTPYKDLESFYKSFLPSTIKSSNKESRMVYYYNHVMTGFAAKLTAEEAKAMEQKEGFVFSRPETSLPLLTTRTPSFLGLNRQSGFWKASNFGKGIIVGVLDSGILPAHASLSDEGIPPPPAKWKGKCEFKEEWCNNKLIGAKNFLIGKSLIDGNGHGTHTASTAAGNFVNGANKDGLANGTASGMAPLAHLAIYKVCAQTCRDSDILAAFDTAINDGVDVLSLSLGGFSRPFFRDTIAIGAYSAIKKGIFVSCAAGNKGEGISPVEGTLSNEAPWILTVGASTIDRRLPETTQLGNGEEYAVTEDQIDPMVAEFSSRGPSQASPGILKPDILGPGVDILAAYPSRDRANSSMNFDFLSGTSMACPHLSGIAALLKASHPDWSPAAIKSAIITSANPNNLAGKPITDTDLQPANVFATGAGQVNPSAANDPGLVYDLKADDYIPYLCGLGYTDDQVGIIAKRQVRCSKESVIQEAQLNYPSFSVTLKSDSLTYTRTVTNVGEANSSYTSEITAPEGVNLMVKPAELNFSKKNQKLSYSVTFTAAGSRNISTPFAQGALTWVSDKHVVRSPIAILFK